MGRCKSGLLKEKVMLEVVFSDTAESDLNEIGEWYKSIRTGLEQEFLGCVEAELELIRKAPLVYREHYKKVRKSIINRFPYGIYYLLEEKRIVVVAIAHHKRGLKIIRKKLKKK